MRFAGSEPAPNAFRFGGQPGHVESYFLRAVDPKRPRALWLKSTVLAPLSGPPVAERWLIWFDQESHQCIARKATQPLRDGAFRGEDIALDEWRMRLGNSGSASGALAGDRFDLSWRALPSAVSAPLALYPWRFMREGRFPKSKLETPCPCLVFSGTAEVAGQSVSLDGWGGSQGHNWGKEHAYRYAWGQCTFAATEGAPETMVEGFTAQVLLAGRLTPFCSALVVRRGMREYRFDGVFDLWRQDAHVMEDRWILRIRNGAGEARLRMNAQGRPMACLGYVNPDGRVSYCFNSKLADTLLEVHPRGEPPFTCSSPFGGALELLRPEPTAGFNVV